MLHGVFHVRCSECIPGIFAAECSQPLDCSTVDPTNVIFAFKQRYFCTTTEIVLSTSFNSLQSNFFILDIPQILLSKKP